MNFKTIYKDALFYLTVPKCVCCRDKLDRSESALCDKCKIEYEKRKNNVCSVCFSRLDECKCSNEYLEVHMVKKLIKVFRYKPSEDPNERIPSNELIYNIKRGKRRDLLNLISDEMIYSIRKAIKYEDFVITNVPRNRSRVLKYGLDHSAEIAKSISYKLGIEYVELLKSKSKEAQKKTHGEQRIKNAEFDYKNKNADIKGKRVILVDDIVTTGASMGACAMLIKGLGAKEVVGAALAIAFKDKYVPFAKDEFWI